MPDTAQIPALAAAQLAQLNAVDASQLVDGAPHRALQAGGYLPSPYGGGGWLPIVLAPVSFKVPTEIGLRFTITIADGQIAIQAPDRADLVAATKLALDGEARAIAAGTEALTKAGLRPPAASWPDALRVIRLDPRLPAAELAGDPGWQLIYDPWDEARGGYHSVLLALPSFAVTSAR